MALNVGNKTNNSVAGDGDSSKSFSHVQDAGSNGLLTVWVSHSLASPFATGVSYGGNALSKTYEQNTTTTEIRHQAWEISTPPTGSNTVLVSFSGAQFNPITTEAISFINANGIGVEAFTDTVGPPATGTISVSSNSMIVGIGTAGTTGLSIDINLSSRTLDWNSNINNFVFGAVSETGLSAGSINYSGSSSASIAMWAVEIQEFVEPSTETSRNTQVVWL